MELLRSYNLGTNRKGRCTLEPGVLSIKNAHSSSNGRPQFGSKNHVLASGNIPALEMHHWTTAKETKKINLHVKPREFETLTKNETN